MVMVQCKETKILKEDGKIMSQDNQKKKLKPKRIKKKLMSNKQRSQTKKSKKALRFSNKKDKI